MKPRINVYSTTASFVIFSLILVGSIIGMFMFIKIMGENTEYPEEKEKKTTTTTTTAVVEVDDNTNENSISYTTTLSDILANKELKDNYSLSVEYQGTNYYFKCTYYQEDTKECISGIALLQYNNNAIPLYVFSEAKDDYSKSNKEYYITVEDNYVFFTYDNNITIYTATGNKYLSLNNIITKYKIGENDIEEEKYPTIEKDNLVYYLCDTNTVFKRTLSLENKNVINQEIISEGIC